MSTQHRRQFLSFGVASVLLSQLGQPSRANADEASKAGGFRRVSVYVDSKLNKTASIDPATGEKGLSVLAFIKLPLEAMPGMVEIYFVALNCSLLGGSFKLEFEGRRLHSQSSIPFPGARSLNLNMTRCKLSVKADDPAIREMTLDPFENGFNPKEWKITIKPSLVK